MVLTTPPPGSADGKDRPNFPGTASWKGCTVSKGGIQVNGINYQNSLSEMGQLQTLLDLLTLRVNNLEGDTFVLTHDGKGNFVAGWEKNEIVQSKLTTQPWSKNKHTMRCTRDNHVVATLNKRGGLELIGAMTLRHGEMLSCNLQQGGIRAVYAFAFGINDFISSDERHCLTLGEEGWFQRTKAVKA
ncbi:hypothetical protein AK830_g8394 [Neonectria ditissima]|uniref:Uncharacterized protein n=1 Tax=Neonectria ditissima TaxID=78410 RepID=A0A0P7BCM8_9HYPO|nr:hypothetical protein AK830_g8394 [Neonectria ditissima]